MVRADCGDLGTISQPRVGFKSASYGHEKRAEQSGEPERRKKAGFESNGAWVRRQVTAGLLGAVR